ncbi:MAG: hypothetical protein WC650_00990 [Candidatus Doudnabacteria bacterium]
MMSEKKIDQDTLERMYTILSEAGLADEFIVILKMIGETGFTLTERAIVSTINSFVFNKEKFHKEVVDKSLDSIIEYDKV